MDNHHKLRQFIIILILLFLIIPTSSSNIIIKIYDPYRSELLYDVYYVNGTFIQEYFGNSSISLPENNSYIFIPEKNIVDYSDPASISRFVGYFMTVLLIILFIGVPSLYLRNKRKK